MVRGAGNIRNVGLPKIHEVSGFKVYDPTMKEQLVKGDVVAGEKIYTYLLVPERGGELELPAVELSYFDPGSGRYDVSKTQPVKITVEGDPSKVTPGSTAGVNENVLGPQIRPIHSRRNVQSVVGDRLFRGHLAWLWLVLAPGIWVAVLVFDFIRRRMASETAGAKRRRARRTARRRMRAADYHIRAQRDSAFYGECARVIYEHLEYRLGEKVESLPLPELRTYLERAGFEASLAEAVCKDLELCDLARFAPAASGPGEMRSVLRRVRTLLGRIEKVRPAVKEASA
jgi:hypothetical protein